MVVLHGGNGLGWDEYVLIALGAVMVGGALFGLWQKRRRQARDIDDE